MEDPFRLLDLPREIRDNIYEHLLRCFPDRPSSWKSLATSMSVTMPTELNFMHNHGVETAILRTSRQVHDEAYVIFLKNEFIRVTLDDDNVRSALVLTQLPFVPMSDRAIDTFRGFVMTHSIRGPGTTSLKLAMLARDLHLLCEAVSWENPRMCLTGGTPLRHRLKIHNPFRRTSSPDFLNVKRQKALLSSYCTHLHSVADFRVTGHVDAALAAAVVAKVTAEPTIGPDEFLAKIGRYKEEGNEHFRAGNSMMANGAWNKALSEIRVLCASGDAWEQMTAAAGGASFRDALAEMVFLLHSNLTASSLRAMREKGSLVDTFLRPAMVLALELAIEGAMTSADLVGAPSWQPTLRQRAKLSFRLATAHRLANDPENEGAMRIAEQLISFARKHAPEDKLIQREEQEIAKWIQDENLRCLVEALSAN